MNTSSTILAKKLSLAGLAMSLLAVYSATASPTSWIGLSGPSGNDNWSTTANWSITPVSDAANFTYTTAVSGPNVTTVNVDGAYQTPGAGSAASYGAFFGQTNGYQTVFIQPGVTWLLGAGTAQPSGGQGVGIAVGPQNINNNNIANFNTVSTGAAYLNYTTITGSGGTLYANVGASTSSLRVESPSTTVNNHNTVLDMSGLGTFIETNSVGLASTVGFYVVNGGQNSQATVYLALTNVISLNNNFQVGYLGSSSNSLPIGVYLGQSNYITTGANNYNMAIGYVGCTSAFMKFNPALPTLGGPNATLPTVFMSGAVTNGTPGSPSFTNGLQTVFICNLASGNVPGSAICDFSGGQVIWQGSSMKLGVSGLAASGTFLGTAANGVLTFSNGLVNFNTILVGDQSVTAGAPGVGTINVGSFATLQASSLITLGAVTGTASVGTTGTLIITNGGTLEASTVTNGGAGSTINMTNANWAVNLTSAGAAANGPTNITVANFNANGVNTINISNITLLPGTGYPATFHLIATTIPANLVGVSSSTFALGPLPTSPNPSYPYAGHLDFSTSGLVNFVLTAGPPSGRSLVWSGMNAGSPDGNWDVATTADWLFNSAATTYNQLDLAAFNDVASPASTSVSLTTALTPFAITVNNTASLYTIGLPSDPGYLSGSMALAKQGAGTLILDSPAANTFTGVVTISGGTLQVGNGDANGNLPTGVSVMNNSVLAYDQTGNVSVGNTISGSGSVVSEGGATLKLAAGNTFTGGCSAINNSTLQGGIANAFGPSGGIVIANGSTLDMDGVGTLQPITVGGSGVGGNGAIINSGGPIYDSASSPIQIAPSITLTGDTTFSFQTRWDMGFPTGATFPLSTSGHPYNLTLNGMGNYFEWREVAADPSLNNITVTGGFFGLTGASTLGNTTSSTLTIQSGANMKLYANDGHNVTINKPLVVQDAATVYNETGANTIPGGMNLNNANFNQFCVFEISATSLTVSGPLTGNGELWMQVSTAPLIINGNASAFTGGALINSGTFTLNSTMGGPGGITNSTGSTVSGTGTANGYMDLSGTFIPGGSNTSGTLTIGTFTAAGGLTLESSAIPVLSLSATTAVGGVNNSLIAVTGNLTVSGNTIFINPVGTLCNGTYTLTTYTGSLIGSFGGVQTVAPSSYNLTLNTSTPGVVQLIVTGAPQPASFAGPYTVSGSSLTLAGTGGTPSGTYSVYTSTNLSTPVKFWTKVGAGSFDGSGNFSFPTPVTITAPHFFILEEP